MEPDDGRIDVPHVPDELVERVRVAAPAGLQNLPGFVIVKVVGGLADGLLDAAAQAVLLEAGDYVAGLAVIVGPYPPVFFSLIATCQPHDVEPFAYLRDVLTRIAAHPMNRLPELLPGRWKSPLG